MAVFSKILSVDLPAGLVCEANGRNPEFDITFVADGEIPFPQHTSAASVKGLYA